MTVDATGLFQFVLFALDATTTAAAAAVVNFNTNDVEGGLFVRLIFQVLLNYSTLFCIFFLQVLETFFEAKTNGNKNSRLYIPFPCITVLLVFLHKTRRRKLVRSIDK